MSFLTSGARLPVSLSAPTRILLTGAGYAATEVFRACVAYIRLIR
jgi:hypothetical protein